MNRRGQEIKHDLGSVVPISAPPMYDEAESQRRKTALFNITNRTLAGTSSWLFQMRCSVFIAFALICYGLYWMEMNLDRKILAGLSFLFVCYAAVNVSGFVRNRQEAQYLTEYAKETNLYSISNIESLHSSDTRYYFHWMAFILAFFAMLGTFWYMDMPSERRGYLLAAGCLLLSQSFTMTKTVRDGDDANRWYRDYHGVPFKTE